MIVIMIVIMIVTAIVIVIVTVIMIVAAGSTHLIQYLHSSYATVILLTS